MLNTKYFDELMFDLFPDFDSICIEMQNSVTKKGSKFKVNSFALSGEPPESTRWSTNLGRSIQMASIQC